MDYMDTTIDIENVSDSIASAKSMLESTLALFRLTRQISNMDTFQKKEIERAIAENEKQHDAFVALHRETLIQQGVLSEIEEDNTTSGSGALFTQKEENKKEERKIRISRWIEDYENKNLIKMKKGLSICSDSIRRAYIGICRVIERRFELFLSKHQTGSSREIISTYMPVEIFNLWTSFQYFSNSHIPFVMEMMLGSCYTSWTQSINLTVDRVPVFLSKNYFKLEYDEIHNGLTHLFRIFISCMEIQYEYETELFVIKATIQKEKFSIFDLAWNKTR